MKKLMVGVLCSVVVSGLLAKDIFRTPVSMMNDKQYRTSLRKGDILDFYLPNGMDDRYKCIVNCSNNENHKQVHNLDEKSIHTKEMTGDADVTCTVKVREKHKKAGERLFKKMKKTGKTKVINTSR